MDLKKICMVIPSFDAKGGIASVVSGYRDSELEKKYKIHYIATYCDGGKYRKLRKAFISYVRFIGEIIFFRPDLLHIHSSFGASFYRKLPFICVGHLLNIPVVNHIHGSELDRFYRNASEFEKKIKKSVFSKCKKIIALSDEWRDQLVVLTNREKITVIQNYGAVHSGDGSHKKTEKVLFMGFLSELKGCFDIPKVVSKVSETLPDVQFVLAGTGTDTDVGILKDNIQALGVDRNIQLPGWIKNDQKEKALESAYLFFLPSYTEGMPMSILEAMGYGLPIVSTNIGGIPQLVKNGENGFLFKPGDTVGFANAIIKILQNPNLREKMGAESLRIVQKSYSLDAHINALSTVYEQCFESK